MKMIKYYFLLLIILIVNYGCNDTVQHPTYYQHIEPIIQRSCVNCHRAGMIGHFELLTYEDVYTKKEAVLHNITTKMMPPWPADPHYVSFANENLLSDKEIELFKKWAKDGYPKGTKNKENKFVVSKEKSFYGKPDLVVPLQTIPIKGNYIDKFLLAKMPFSLPHNTYAKLIEFVPGNTKVVHHVNGQLVRYDQPEKKKNIFSGVFQVDAVNDSTVVDLYKKMDLLYDDGTFPTLFKSAFNYLPGVIPPTLPDGIGTIPLGTKNAFLLKDIHYGPYWEDTVDNSYVNIFFTNTPPKRKLEEIQLGTLGISPVVPELIIPPNEEMTVHSKYTINEDISLMIINPHMHLLGKKFWAYALTPEQDTIRIISIPKWDFNWQYFYKPKKPIIIPAGSTIYAWGIYDNTVNNPFNPNQPPQTVIGKNGRMRTRDEMFQLILSYVKYEKGDEDLDLSK